MNRHGDPPPEMQNNNRSFLWFRGIVSFLVAEGGRAPAQKKPSRAVTSIIGLARRMESEPAIVPILEGAPSHWRSALYHLASVEKPVNFDQIVRACKNGHRPNVTTQPNTAQQWIDLAGGSILSLLSCLSVRSPIRIDQVADWLAGRD
jgi:hypothetical protein